MAELKYAEMPERREEAKGDLALFLQSKEAQQFTEQWHKEGYTKIGIHELLGELYRRYSGDEKRALERGGEILAVLKNIDLGKFKIKSEGLMKALRKAVGGE